MVEPTTAAIAATLATLALVVVIAVARDREYRRGRMDEADERDTIDMDKRRDTALEEIVIDLLDAETAPESEAGN